MKKLFTCIAISLLASCAAPPKPLTPATSPTTALQRISEEIVQLAPMLQPTEAPPLAYWVFPATPSDSVGMTKAKATELLLASPNLINDMMRDLAPTSSIYEVKQRKIDIGQRLRKLLRERPDLDLAWYWLANTETVDSVAITDLTHAIRLNPQVGEYYRQRGLCYELVRNYTAGIADLQKARPFFHQSWDVDRELADLYVLAGDHARYLACWEQRQREMRAALAQLDKSGRHNVMQLADQSQLRDEINYGYLARAEYFIEQRHQPAQACPDLTRAVAAGVEEARELQKKYCH